MRPLYIPDFIDPTAPPWVDLYDRLLAEAPWVNLDGAPRDECFMALDPELTYSYGNSNQRRTRVYKATPMHPAVRELLARLNAGGDRYNVCVLNYYRDQHRHLGWHADDSPEQDPAHPIAVLAFGATRELWVKPRGATGAVPEADRYALTPGTLFVMPPGFQDAMLHRIPKHDRPCGGRISLTYRKLDRAAPPPVTP